MVVGIPSSEQNAKQSSPLRLGDELRHHDLPRPNLDTVRELDTVRGRNRRSRLYLEDELDDEPSTDAEYDPSIGVIPDTKRTYPVSVVFAILLMVLAGSGGALAWRSYGDQATDLIRGWELFGSASKPTAPPDGFAELQQQLNAIATDLAAMKHTLEQQSAATHDQLIRVQEQIAQQSIALQATKQELSQKFSSSPPADKSVHAAVPKLAQHAAHVSTQASAKPLQVSPPQSLLEPKQ